MLLEVGCHLGIDVQHPVQVGRLGLLHLDAVVVLALPRPAVPPFSSTTSSTVRAWLTPTVSRLNSNGAASPSVFRSVMSVTIDRTGRWWTGSEAGDIEEYLADLTAGQEDAAAKFSRSQCSDCGSEVFTLRYDASAGWAERRCTACRSIHTMLGSADLVAGVKPKDARCRCGRKSFNLAVGFAPQRRCRRALGLPGPALHS